MLPRLSSDSVRIISLDRDSLMERLCEISRRLRAEHPEVADVRVFGSLARGDYTGTSDVDILIVLDRQTESDPVRRILIFLPYFDLGRGADLLIYTQEEIRRRLSQEDHFLCRIWHDSISLGTGKLQCSERKLACRLHLPKTALTMFLLLVGS